MAASLIGRKLGKYEIRELIGQGGMATVYKGYQPDVDRYVAIKVLPPHPGQDTQFVERFRLEARTIARLQHPHILPMYDYGDEGGILYLATAYIDGGSLSSRLRRGAMPLQDIERLLPQIGSALDYAHRQGVVHRDIKPDNILIDREGYALLADFGIVKLVESGSNLTVTGGMMGTPAYMSPEQGQGLPVDKRSDIYSLGTIVYEMLTGAQPFTADTPMQIVFKHITETPPALHTHVPNLPPALNQVLQRALEKNPDDRYQTASELVGDFFRAARGAAVEYTVVEPTPPPSSAPAAYSAPSSPTPLFASPAPTPAPIFASPAPTPVPTTMTTGTGWNPVVLLGGFAIIAVLVVVLVVILLNFGRPAADTPVVPSPTVPPAQVATTTPERSVSAAPTFGSVRFTTTGSPGDTVHLQFRDLPQAGQAYYAWLRGVDGSWLSLGELRPDALGGGVSVYTDEQGRSLPTLFDALVITREESPGDAPGETVAYSGGVPAEVPRALSAILISSPDGINNASLLESSLIEARIALQHAGLAANALSIGGLHTHAEHTINILRGTNDDLDNSGSGSNPGRGVGVYALFDKIDETLAAAANAPDATAAVQAQLELIGVCVTNARTWADRVIEIELALIRAESMDGLEAWRTESTEVATAVMQGIDLNENGQVEPFEGECGLEQIPAFGISVGNMNIYAGALPQGDAD